MGQRGGGGDLKELAIGLVVQLDQSLKLVPENEPGSKGSRCDIDRCLKGQTKMEENAVTQTPQSHTVRKSVQFKLLEEFSAKRMTTTTVPTI